MWCTITSLHSPLISVVKSLLSFLSKCLTPELGRGEVLRFMPKEGEEGRKNITIKNILEKVEMEKFY